MVVQKIKDINPWKIRQAKGVMAVLELLGITEEDLLLLKEIPAIKKELEELREFKDKTLRTIENKSEDNKAVGKVVKDVYNTQTKEFNPHYGEE